jgi:MFS family permease
VQLRRARAAVALLFLTNGAVPANLIPRLPEIKSVLDLPNTELGLAVAAGPLGALASGLAAGLLIRRFRSSRVAVVGMAISSVCVLLAGLAPAWWLLAAALFGVGAMDSVADVAQNSHGLRVQRLYGRSILNSFHAVWSTGALAGGLMGAAAAGLRMPLAMHLALSGGLFCGLNLACCRFLLAGPEPTGAASATDRTATPSRPRAGLTYAVLMALAGIALSGSVVEDAGATWAAVYLSGSLGAGATVAALGFVALVGMQFVGRTTGDRLVDRFGQRAVARAGGAITAAGMGLALAVPTVPTTVLGFGAAGFGVATLVPAAMHTADQLPGFRAGHRPHHPELADVDRIPARAAGRRRHLRRDVAAAGAARGAARRCARRPAGRRSGALHQADRRRTSLTKSELAVRAGPRRGGHTT